MSECQYCGKETRALKNHVRLSSGGGHGAYGSYPDGFENGGGQQLDLTESDDSGTETEAQPEASTQEETGDQWEAIEVAADTAYNEGYEDGYEEGLQAGQKETLTDEELEELWQQAWEQGYEQAMEDADTGSSTVESDDEEQCPDCGHDHYYDATEALQHPGTDYSNAEKKALREHSRVCAECGEVYG